LASDDLLPPFDIGAIAVNCDESPMVGAEPVKATPVTERAAFGGGDELDEGEVFAPAAR
jgi:hypothetical protein